MMQMWKWDMLLMLGEPLTKGNGLIRDTWGLFLRGVYVLLCFEAPTRLSVGTSNGRVCTGWQELELHDQAMPGRH